MSGQGSKPDDPSEVTAGVGPVPVSETQSLTSEWRKRIPSSPEAKQANDNLELHKRKVRRLVWRRRTRTGWPCWGRRPWPWPQWTELSCWPLSRRCSVWGNASWRRSRSAAWRWCRRWPVGSSSSRAGSASQHRLAAGEWASGESDSTRAKRSRAMGSFPDFVARMLDISWDLFWVLSLSY